MDVNSKYINYFVNCIITIIKYDPIKGGVKELSNLSIYVIYTIKTRLICIYVRIYTLVCSELIEETGRNWKTSRADFWHVRIFLAWLGQV